MAKIDFITFDEKLEAAWGLHKIEKQVFEKEIAELKAENEKLTSAYNNGYHDALEAAAELAGKILIEIEGMDFEVPAKIRELHAAAIRGSGE